MDVRGLGGQIQDGPEAGKEGVSGGVQGHGVAWMFKRHITFYLPYPVGFCQAGSRSSPVTGVKVAL